MIKLDRPPSPIELDEATVNALTAEYIADNDKRVWNQSYIKSALLTMSDNKCSYCECNIIEESKYMEIDHFRSKKYHPDKVVVWENLLPSCKRCNIKKGKHNVDSDGMIVDPTIMSPKDHLYFQDCILHHKDDIGKATIEACGLNQTDRLFSGRVQLFGAMHTSIETAKGLLEDHFLGSDNNRKRNRAISTVAHVLMTCGPNKPYSAFIATSILRHPSYIWLREELNKLNSWDELVILEEAAKSVALP